MKKYILILILILTLLSGLLFYFLKNKNNKEKVETFQNIEDFQTLKQNKEETLNKELHEVSKEIAQSKSSENSIVSEIKDFIVFWEEKDDLNSLITAIRLTNENMSNERIISLWEPTIRTNSSKIVLSLSNEPDKKTLFTASVIYDWFINLSGEYEKLTKEERQKISRDLMQIQLYLK